MNFFFNNKKSILSDTNESIIKSTPFKKSDLIRELDILIRNKPELNYLLVNDPNQIYKYKNFIFKNVSLLQKLILLTKSYPEIEFIIKKYIKIFLILILICNTIRCN